MIRKIIQYSLLIFMLVILSLKPEFKSAAVATVESPGKTEISKPHFTPTAVTEVIQIPEETDTSIEPTFTCEPVPSHIKEFMAGKSYKENAPFGYDELVYLTITYINFEEEVCIGGMIVAKELGNEVLEIFQELFEKQYPIEKIQLIDHYDANDHLSMDDNNTSAFNFRLIQNSDKISNHGLGKAIDINPVQNPYVRNQTVEPSAGYAYLDREDIRKGMVVEGDDCYNAFVSRGWQWGGNWKSLKDYQHFEKP